jgi:hypothetical protein
MEEEIPSSEELGYEAPQLPAKWKWAADHAPKRPLHDLYGDKRIVDGKVTRVKIGKPDLDIALGKLLSEKSGDFTALEWILRKLRAQAIDGNLQAAYILLERAYGKPKQALQLEDPDNEIQITIERTRNQHLPPPPGTGTDTESGEPF